MFDSISKEEVLKNVPDFDSNYTDIMKSSYSLEATEFFEPPGKNIYRLLSYFSTKFQNTQILDIGTYNGNAALALSYNKTNKVYSFVTPNQQNCVGNSAIQNTGNIEFHPENILDTTERTKWRDFILLCPLIFFDSNTQTGIDAYDFYCYLVEIQYRGLLIVDDIWHFKEVRDNFWYKIPREQKYDFTEIGHWSGTGAINFSVLYKFPPKPDLSKWTLVTAYFDISDCPDANHHIKDRGSEYYLGNANSTLSAPYNMVIFCDETQIHKIKAIRSAYVPEKSKTKYVLCNFEDIRFKKNGQYSEKCVIDYRDQVLKNRENNEYYTEKWNFRNNATYYVQCMVRYSLIKEAIDLNPFGSTHFCWLNMCLEKVGYRNFMYLENALALYRTKISACYIDYIPEHIVHDLETYFQYGRCSIASGFITGTNEHMYKFCDLMEDRFLDFLNRGYGHADEQLIPPIYFDHPELFDFYYGDYNQIITNYEFVHENIESLMCLFVRHSFEQKNYKICYDACETIWRSWCLGKCVIPENYLHELFIKYMYCKTYLKDI